MPKLIHEIGDTILKINKEQKLSFIIVEQNLNLIKKTTQKYIVLEKGKVVKQGITNDIIKDKNIIDKYLSV